MWFCRAHESAIIQSRHDHLIYASKERSPVIKKPFGVLINEVLVAERYSSSLCDVQSCDKALLAVFSAFILCLTELLATLGIELAQLDTINLGPE